jgi:hypothetical protein
MSRQLLIPVKDLKTNENIDGLNNTIYAVKVVEVLKKRRKKVYSSKQKHNWEILLKLNEGV